MHKTQPKMYTGPKYQPKCTLDQIDQFKMCIEFFVKPFKKFTGTRTSVKVRQTFN